MAHTKEHRMKKPKASQSNTKRNKLRKKTTKAEKEVIRQQLLHIREDT